MPSAHPPRSSSPRRLLAGALAAASLVAACGGGGGGDAAVAPTTAVAAPSSLAPASTATTAASPSTTVPATTTTDDPIDAIAGKPGFAGSTTTVPAGPPVYPLTGTPLEDPAIAARSALVVKIDNAPGARPQTGFNAADIVFEEIVNDNLTRFAMVFHSQGSDPVGPVRSGRIQDIDLFGALQHPLFAWSGGNATVTEAIRASDLVDLGPAARAVYFRSSDRRSPHNLYSNTSALWSLSPPDARPPVQQFRYRSPDEPVAGAPSQGVGVRLDSIDVEWNWDGAAGLYVRRMEGQPHMDRAGGQVSANNVVVLAMEYVPGISDSPDAQTLGHGEAFVFTGGAYVHGRWERVDRLQPFILTADDGTPIELSPGRTFVELPRVGATSPFGP